MHIDSGTDYLKFIVALMSIVNPVGAVPVFLNLTVGQPAPQRRRTGRVAALAVAGVLGVSLLGGEAILRFFGITIASFRVGGGILLLLMAVSMLHGRLSPVRHTEEEARDSAERDSIAVVPLGIPFLAGPGAISTVILYAQRHASPGHYLILGGEILAVALTVWASLSAAPLIARALGRTGINVVTRLMGLIMAAIGVEFIAVGLKQLFPILS